MSPWRRSTVPKARPSAASCCSPTIPLRRAEIFPQDDATLSGIASIRVSGTTSRWQLDNGLRLGMTLAELVAANGKPVSFSGLGWDYGGGILDWHGGRLAPPDGGTLFFAVGLTHGEVSDDDSIPAGDSQFRSDDARYPRQGTILFVGQLLVSFPTPMETDPLPANVRPEGVFSGRYRDVASAEPAA